MRSFLFVLLLPAVGAAAQAKDPAIQFSRCKTTQKHIAVQEMDGFYIIHLHVLVRSCANKTAFARVRCACDAEGSRRDYLDVREVTIGDEEELWGFYLNTPKFESNTGVTYQIEVGYKDASKVDEYQVLDTFGWKVRDGKKMYGGTKDEPIYVSIPKRTVIVEGGSIKIKTVFEATVPTKSGELNYDFVEKLPHSPVKGDNWADKIK